MTSSIFSLHFFLFLAFASQSLVSHCFMSLNTPSLHLLPRRIVPTKLLVHKKFGTLLFGILITCLRQLSLLLFTIITIPRPPNISLSSLFVLLFHFLLTFSPIYFHQYFSPLSTQQILSPLFKSQFRLRGLPWISNSFIVLDSFFLVCGHMPAAEVWICSTNHLIEKNSWIKGVWYHFSPFLTLTDFFLKWRHIKIIHVRHISQMEHPIYSYCFEVLQTRCLNFVWGCDILKFLDFEIFAI